MINGQQELLELLKLAMEQSEVSGESDPYIMMNGPSEECNCLGCQLSRSYNQAQEDHPEDSAEESLLKMIQTIFPELYKSINQGTSEAQEAQEAQEVPKEQLTEVNEPVRDVYSITFSLNGDGEPYKLPKMKYFQNCDSERIVIGLPYYTNEDDINVSINDTSDKLHIKTSVSKKNMDLFGSFLDDFAFGINLIGPSDIKEVQFNDGLLIVDTKLKGKSFEELKINFK